MEYDYFEEKTGGEVCRHRLGWLALHETRRMDTSAYFCCRFLLHLLRRGQYTYGGHYKSGMF